ncbi:MAG TPA: response regulator [Micropepsaceae bacterium]|nr:response regulator [Micropepsaceae bacterium]
MSDLQETVLVVDDEFLIAMSFCAQVEEMGLCVCGTAATAETAIAKAQKYRPAVVLMDMRLSGQKDGVDAAMAIHHEVGSKVIFITASREPGTVERVFQDHPFALLFKPVSSRQLRTIVMDAMRG